MSRIDELLEKLRCTLERGFERDRKDIEIVIENAIDAIEDRFKWREVHNVDK